MVRCADGFVWDHHARQNQRGPHVKERGGVWTLGEILPEVVAHLLKDDAPLVSATVLVASETR